MKNEYGNAGSSSETTNLRSVKNKWARNQIHAAKNKGIVERLIGQLVGLTIL